MNPAKSGYGNVVVLDTEFVSVDNSKNPMTIKDLSDLVDVYLMMADYGSAHSLTQRTDVLTRMVHFFRVEGVREITPMAMYEFRRSLSQYKASTAKQYIKIINVFFNWCIDMELLVKNPITRTVRAIRVPKQERAFLNTEQVQHLLYAKRPSGYKEDVFLRDKAICVLMAMSGLRESEVCALNLQDIDFKNGSVHVVRGKGGVERYSTLPEDARSVIKDYVNHYRHRLAKEDDALFLATRKNLPDNGKGFRRLSQDGISKSVERYTQTMLGRKDISPHVLRHTFASVAVENGMNVKDLQKLLGHGNLNTTATYVHSLKSVEQTIKSGNEVFNRLPGRKYFSKREWSAGEEEK